MLCVAMLLFPFLTVECSSLSAGGALFRETALRRERKGEQRRKRIGTIGKGEEEGGAERLNLAAGWVSQNPIITARIYIPRQTSQREDHRYETGPGRGITRESDLIWGGMQ